MAKLPLIRRILREDLPEAPEWILPLLDSINQFFDSVYYALNRNLTLVENVDTQYKTFRVFAGTNPEDNTFNFALTMHRVPVGLTVEKVTQIASTYVPITSPVFCSWRVESTTIVIDAVTGLTAGQSYDITVLVK
jgi:hypothetical protein